LHICFHVVDDRCDLCPHVRLVERLTTIIEFYHIVEVIQYIVVVMVRVRICLDVKVKNLAGVQTRAGSQAGLPFGYSRSEVGCAPSSP
jgi:hypothetical protein